MFDYYSSRTFVEGTQDSNYIKDIGFMEHSVLIQKIYQTKTVLSYFSFEGMALYFILVFLRSLSVSFSDSKYNKSAEYSGMYFMQIRRNAY